MDGSIPHSLAIFFRSLAKKQGNLFKGGPPFPYHAEVRDVITPYIHRAIKGEMTPEAALDLAAQDVDALLQSLHYGE